MNTFKTTSLIVSVLTLGMVFATPANAGKQASQTVVFRGVVDKSIPTFNPEKLARIQAQNGQTQGIVFNSNTTEKNLAAYASKSSQYTVSQNKKVSVVSLGM